MEDRNRLRASVPPSISNRASLVLFPFSVAVVDGEKQDDKDVILMTKRLACKR